MVAVGPGLVRRRSSDTDGRVPELTILRGTVISEKGEPVGKPGYGRMVRPVRPGAQRRD